MSEIKLYVNTHTNINEGRECNIYFRKNDIIITDSDYGDVISLNYDLELNSLSNDINKNYNNKDFIKYSENDKLEKIVELDIRRYNIVVSKIFYKVNKNI